MAIGQIHVGDIATALRATIYDNNGAIVDLSDASDLLLLYQKPDRSIGSWEASFYDDGTDGVIQYVTSTANDLDQAGVWNLQGKVTISGALHRSDVVDFRVYPNIS